MDIDYKVPFYANTPDDTHCVQACLLSILKYFIPDKGFSWEELDKATAKVKDLWTWPMAGLMWMQGQGFDVHNIELFDYQRFIKDGKNYLIDIYGQEIADIQDRMSKIPQEQLIAKEFIKKIKTELREPTLEDIKHYLKEGYLITVSVNARTLNHEDGYVGHQVVVKGLKSDDIIYHDPGSPAIENRITNFEDFDKAWAYPKDDRVLMAFKREQET